MPSPAGVSSNKRLLDAELGCTVDHGTPAGRETPLQPQDPVCNQKALKAWFPFICPVCVTLAAVHLYSDSCTARW